jgi:formamidopyrimidine-DNA glycosylase
MPELPEVESVRRGLDALVGCTITRARLLRRSVLVVPGDPDGGWERNRSPARPRRHTASMLLDGATIALARRHGKQLALVASDSRVLLAHLGMTGSFRVLAPRAHAPSDHVHAVWTLDDARRLAFRDPRRFGGLWFLPTRADLDARWAALGPDALTVTPAQLAPRVQRSARPVKAALLDQAVIAGVGNIYADEALFRARLHPLRRAADLTSDELDRLAAAIRAVLAEALQAGGSTLRDFVAADGSPGSYRAAHRVYGRAGLPCPDCGSPLASARVAQRATVWCPTCQPPPRPQP